MGKGAGVVERKENGLVDITKVICALIVVAGHCYLADVPGFAWYTNLVTLAVQIFFIFSGYFLIAAHTLEQEQKATKYVRHLFGMTMVWAVFYFILNLLITDKSSAVWVYDFMNLWTEFFSSFNSGHLWYLQNMLIVVVLLLGMKKTSFSWKETLALFVIATLFYGRITRAVLGIAVGICLAQMDGKMQQCKGKADAKMSADASGKVRAGKNKSLGMFLIGAATLAAAGGILWMGNHNAAVTGIMTNYIINMTSILLAYAALHMPMPSGKVNYVYIRKQSTLIYLVHLLLVPFVAKVMAKLPLSGILGGEKGLIWCLCLAAIVTVGSVIFGAIVIALAKHEKFAWLKKLY